MVIILTTQDVSVLFTVKSLNNQIKRTFDKSALHDNKEGLTGMHFAVIGFIADRETDQDVFQRDVEKEFNIRRPTATTLLQLMEKKGLLAREAVPGDGRLRKIVLTDHARELGKKMHDQITQISNQMVEGVDPADLDIFLKVCNQISRNLRYHFG